MVTQLAETMMDRPELGWVGVLFGVIMVVIALAVLVLVIAALISALINPDTTGGGKLLWVLVILWYPIIGAVAWFVLGRKRHLNRLVGIDKGPRHSGPPSNGQHSDVAQPPPGGPGAPGSGPGGPSGAGPAFGPGTGTA
ncbi:PLDc_N domain-containing protein [Nocardiopsis sp. HNM0947]|uniref:PLDc_N domain-containing protein n=1 Tax=Nocardiopsis coralli TaxID=2772213 RepID=A0ABR9P2V2_9ACTN|nr:PLD nuclease N-terminal domain-containing protein [Nocardiopsis coralli]MBE2998178.1 PLDc_N domain-containing protein [Nocardiopsis coralli]